MKNITELFTWLIFCLLFQQPAFSFELPDDSPDLGEFTPGEKWREGGFQLPAYPDDDKLVRVEMELENSQFKFYIDPDSLSMSKDDVVRYTVVIKSSSGATNVMHEGMRCSVREFRTYAYGTSDGKFSKARVSEWKPFYDGDNMKHRYNFYHYYMCSKIQLPYRPDIIMQRIRYPSAFNEGGEGSDW